VLLPWCQCSFGSSFTCPQLCWLEEHSCSDGVTKNQQHPAHFCPSRPGDLCLARAGLRALSAQVVWLSSLLSHASENVCTISADLPCFLPHLQQCGHQGAPSAGAAVNGPGLSAHDGGSGGGGQASRVEVVAHSRIGGAVQSHHGSASPLAGGSAPSGGSQLQLSAVADGQVSNPFFASSAVIIETFEPGVTSADIIDKYDQAASKLNGKGNDGVTVEEVDDGEDD